MVKKQAHATPQEVWDLLREFQKENDRGFKELRESQKESQKELRESQKELRESQKESQKELRESQKESQKELRESQKELRDSQKESRESQKESRESQKELRDSQKETDRQINKTSQKVEDLSNSIEEQGKNLDKASGNFNNKWGAFIERLVAGDLVSLLEEQGIPVRQITSRKILYREDKTELGEYDLIAYNGDAIVITEVKNTLTRGKIDKFLKKLESYKKQHLIYSDKKVFGAMGFLESEEGSADYAESKGLFIIRSPEGKSDMSKIVNKEGFKPTPF